jgi:hypothetical protein
MTEIEAGARTGDRWQRSRSRRAAKLRGHPWGGKHKGTAAAVDVSPVQGILVRIN